TDSLSLLPASVGIWGPFLFANPDPEAEPLEQWLGELPAILARDLDLGDLAFHSHVEFGSNAHWNVVTENFLECYHFPTAHRRLRASARSSTSIPPAPCRSRIRRSRRSPASPAPAASAASSICSTRTRASTCSRAPPTSRSGRSSRPRRAGPSGTSTTSSHPS